MTPGVLLLSPGEGADPRLHGWQRALRAVAGPGPAQRRVQGAQGDAAPSTCLPSRRALALCLAVPLRASHAGGERFY